MSLKCSSTSLLSLIWETERPCGKKDVQSPPFTYMNHEWFLKLKIDDRDPPSFDLFMETKEKLEVFPTITVRTFYKKSGSDDALFNQCQKISQCGDYISRVNISDLAKIDKFNVYGIFTIVCELHDSDISPQRYASEVQILSLEKLSNDFEVLLNSEVLPDVQLMVEETSIPCHRAVLVARSKVFTAMFQHEMTESTSNVLEIKDIELSTIKVFLQYLYSGKIPEDLTEEALSKLYECSDKYEVNILKKVSSSALMKLINTVNYLTYMTLADTHSDQEFKNAVAHYIVKDNSLLKSKEWINFSCENPVLANEVYSKYFNK